MKQDIIYISSPFNTIKNENGGKGILILHKRNKKISIEGTFYKFSDIDSYEIAEEIIQKVTDSYIKKVDEILADKEKELMDF